MQETIALIYRDGRIANLHATAWCATDRQGVIAGDKGFLVVDNINNPTCATAWDRYGHQLGHWEAPARISGFEYEFLACRDAIAHGLCEPADMPHAESIRVMRLMDRLRAEWDVRFPGDRLP
jgi:predicted dehydrogenase